MKLNEFKIMIQEERIGGARASWTNREIKDTVKSMLRMDRYALMNNSRFINAFMIKFNPYIKKHNLNKRNIKEIAKMELERQSRLMT